MSIRKDRQNGQIGGGICTYFRNNIVIDFLHLHEFEDPNFESQWFLIKLKQLPRGINAVILATIYHPPSSNDSSLRAHFFQNLDIILSKFPNSAIIIMGDFNQFNAANLCSSFKLKKLVILPTRGNNILDQVYSTLSQYYLNAQILPPIGMSDHSCVLISPCNYIPKSYPTARVFKRLSRPSNKLSLSSSLSSNNWTPSIVRFQFMTNLICSLPPFLKTSILICRYEASNHTQWINPG